MAAEIPIIRAITRELLLEIAREYPLLTDLNLSNHAIERLDRVEWLHVRWREVWCQGWRLSIMNCQRLFEMCTLLIFYVSVCMWR